MIKYFVYRKDNLYFKECDIDPSNNSFIVTNNISDAHLFVEDDDTKLIEGTESILDDFGFEKVLMYVSDNESSFFNDLVKEANQLAIKIEHLSNWLQVNDGSASSFSIEYLALMERQLDVMKEYLKILQKRILILCDEYRSKNKI